MKNTFLFALAAMVAFAASAQINKGVKLVGGSVSFQSTKEKIKSGGTTFDLGTTTTFQVMPMAGIFVIDNLAAGAGVTFSSTNSKPEGNEPDSKVSLILFNPFLRYYVKNLFGEGQVGFGSQKIEFGTSSIKSSVFRWQLGVGYVAFLSSTVGLEPFIGYQSLSEKEDDDTSSNSGLIFSLALQVYLGRE